MKKTVVTLGIFLIVMVLLIATMSGCTEKSDNSEAANNTNTNVAAIQGDVQTVTSKLGSRSYPPITVQKGIPVKWTIQADAGNITGCNNRIIIPRYNIEKKLVAGDNIIEFTPTESGTVPFSCWMGMIGSQINVVDDVSKPSVANTAVKSGGNDQASQVQAASQLNSLDGIAQQESDNNNQGAALSSGAGYNMGEGDDGGCCGR